MKCAYLIAGARCDKNFVRECLNNKKEEDIIIAIDSGLEVLYELDILPDIIVGDFDSISNNILDKYNNSKLLKVNSEKDFSDTELAFEICIEKGFKKVFLLEALGKRMDHTLSNIFLLSKYIEKLDISILDKYNKIYLKNKNFSISKNSRYGKYISFYPLNSYLENFSLFGFKYPLDKVFIDITKNPSLTLSNELIDEEGKIEFSNEFLLCIESKDILD